MYKPNFKYTNEIVNNLIKIESAREIINNSKIIPSYDLLLKNKAIIESSYNSTSIEGNPLDFKEVESLFNSNDLINSKISKSEQEVINYFNVLKNFDNYQEEYPNFSKDFILSIHYELTKGLLKNPGQFRKTQVIIGNLKTGKLNFIPPKEEKIIPLINNFIDWLNKSSEISPVLISGISHYELVRIHPFVDGNGRTSRALSTYILSFKGFDFKKYFTLDEFYNKNRENYYNALRSADKTNDLTEWLEYFTFGFLQSINKVKEEVINLSKFSNKYNDILELNEKEIKILHFIEENQYVKNKDIQELLNVSSQSAYTYLNNLVKKNLISSSGEGRSTHYIINK
ncbi:Fic family protein [Methanobrevibacter sp. DSM 116169]|uniref:Fic family protein n=1 Tax=Methanobrevibacter sp. DSM 116169 TaxID=3242727 RepID=UPI0038FD26BA